MATVTIEVPDELSELIAQAGERLPELLERSLREPALPAHTYRYVLDFIARRPLPEEIAAFGPTSEMSERLRTLIERESSGDITPTEKAELDEYERLEHLMIMIKAGSLNYLTGASVS
jgi:type VI protein secretion system component VasF